MNKLLNIYNNTYHRRIKCSPKDMFDNVDLEYKYIESQLKQKHKQEYIRDFNLNVGSFVRYDLLYDLGENIHTKFSVDISPKSLYFVRVVCFCLSSLRGRFLFSMK